MEKLTQIFSYLEVAGAFQGLFLCLLLFQTPKSTLSTHALLTALLLAASLQLCWTALHDSRYLAYLPDLISLGPSCTLLFGPLLYLYVQKALLPTRKWKGIYWLHFVPFLLFQLGHIPFYAKPYVEKQAFILNHYVNHPALDVWSQLPLVQFFLYMIPVIRLVNKHQQALKEYFSAIEQAKLSWLRNLMGALGLLWLIFIVGNALVGLQVAGSLFALLLSGFLYYIGYKCIRHPVMYPIPTPMVDQPALTASITAKPGEDIKKKYQKSELPEAKRQQYVSLLTELMEEDKLYRQSKLTLQEVADTLLVSPHHVSQVLNQYLHINFYDFVNRYRVEEVKAELLNPRKKHLTILAIALEAGFESKATFNAAFKKYTGLTPSVYKKQAGSKHKAEPPVYQQA